MAFIGKDGREYASQAGLDSANARYDSMNPQKSTPATSIVNPQTNTNAQTTQNTAATQAKADIAPLPAISSSGGFTPTADKANTGAEAGLTQAQVDKIKADRAAEQAANPTVKAATTPAGQEGSWINVNKATTTTSQGSSGYSTADGKTTGSEGDSQNIADTANTTDATGLDGKKLLDEQASLTKAQLDAEKEFEGVQMQLAQERYEAEQRNLDQMQKLADDALANRNAALEAGSEVQRKDAQTAMDFAATQADLQRQRSTQTYNDQIVEQKVANTKRKLQEESRIAALGGFGSSASRSQQLETSVGNDRLLNNLVFQKDISDKEISAQLDNIHKEYVNNLNKIEVQKQTAIQQNYDKYLEYVADISKSKEMSEQAKSEAIKNAAANYKTQISQINSQSFTQRYEMSITLADRAKTELNEQKNDARTTLVTALTAFANSDTEMTPAMLSDVAALEKKAGLPIGTSLAQLDALKKAAKAQNLEIMTEMNDKGDMTVYSVDKTTGKVVNQQKLEGIGKLTEEKGHWSYEKDDFGNTIAFNEMTGESKNLGKNFNPSNFGGAQSGGNSPGNSTFSVSKGNVAVGGLQIPEQEFDKIFNVGGYGGQCGTWASTKSTAVRVGNTWDEKKNAIDKQDNPKAGDKLLLPLQARSDGKGTGHVALVVSYNEGTGDIGVVESNIDGKGTIRKATYNLNTLKQKYGENFGFASGQLRPEVKKEIADASTGPVNTVAQPTSQPTIGSNESYESIYNRLVPPGSPVTVGKKIVDDYLKGKTETKSKVVKPTGTKSTYNPRGYSSEDAALASDVEKKNGLFASLAVSAEKDIDVYDKTNFKTSAGLNKSLSQIATTLSTGKPMDVAMTDVIDNIQNPVERELADARLRWVLSVLRPESGAAISIGEYFTKTRAFFPDAKSTDADVRKKKHARDTQLTGLIEMAGPAIGAYNLDEYNPDATSLDSTLGQDDSDEIDNILNS